MFFSFVCKIYYFVIYYLFYKYSGAHNKPTSDKRHNPTLEHQKNIFYTLVRRYEEGLFNKFTASSVISHRNNPLTLNTLSLIEVNVDNINPIMFRELTNNKTTPLVIRGLIKECPAVKMWSEDYFSTNYGDTKLLTLLKGDKDNNNNTRSKAYTSFTERLDCDYLSLRESIENMKVTSGKFYINNVTEIFHLHPELIRDLDLNQLHQVDSSIDEKTWLKVNMFLGGEGSGSSLHCAVGGNFFFNVYGKKKWVLINPKYTPFLKSTPAEHFGFVISGEDLENPSSVRWNNLIPKYEVILNPGDVLYIPPWWWHYVHNETNFTIGCAVRDHTVYYQSFINNPMFMLMSPYTYKLNPLFLKLAEYLKGRDFLVKKSMESDQHIIGHLTGKYKIKPS